MKNLYSRSRTGDLFLTLYSYYLSNQNKIRLISATISTEIDELNEGRRLKRFFAMFSHIETLVLENFKSSIGPGRSVFDAVQWTLGGVRINNMEIRNDYMNEELQSVLMNFSQILEDLISK